MLQKWTSALVVTCWMVGTASADPPSMSAKEHFQKGTQAYDLQHWEEAAQEYETAYQIKPDPALLFNIGQAHRQAKHWDRADLAFRSYLRNAPRSANRARVEQMIEEVRAAAAEEKRLAEEKARKEAEDKLAAEKRHADDLERQRAIAEAQARAEEARAGRPHADPALAARARKHKLIGIGLAAGGGGIALIGGGVFGAAGAIANRYNNAPVDMQYSASDESRWRSERTAGIALLAVGGVVAVAGTALAVISARKQKEASTAMWVPPNGAMFAATGGAR